MAWIGPVAAAAVGAGIGLLGNRGGGTQTATQTNDPWSGVQPHLMDLFGRGQGLLSQPNIGAQSPLTGEAIAEMQRLYGDPNSGVRQAQGEMGRVLGGEYLDVDRNPFVQRAAQRGIDQALIGVNSRFGPEGYGGSANREWATRIASEAAIPFYAGEYGRERGNMMNAMGMAPGLSMAHLSPLLQGAQMQETRSQAEVDAPWTQLSRYRGLLTGTPGGTTTMSTPYYGGNAAAAGLGGGLAGLSLYNAWPRTQQQDYSMRMPAQDQYQQGWSEAWSPFMGGDYGGGGGF